MRKELLRQRKKLWEKQLNRVKSIVYDFIRVLSENGLVVDELYLFGSRARGDFSLYSDIDLVVVSDDWRGLPMNRRLSILYRLWGYDYDVTFYPLTRDELIKWIDRSIVLRDASKYWIKIYSRNHGPDAIDNKDSFKT